MYWLATGNAIFIGLFSLYEDFRLSFLFYRLHVKYLKSPKTCRLQLILLFYKLFSPMVLLVWLCLFHFHISEVLNNKTVFTDYITPKLFRDTCNFSHFLKKTVPRPTC